MRAGEANDDPPGKNTGREAGRTRAKRAAARKLRVIGLEQLDVGRLFGDDIRADCNVRRAFVRRDAERYEPVNVTPMMRQLRGGRGGEVRLKLYLGYLWHAKAAPYVVKGRTARDWAKLLGLPQPATNGAHRVGKALGWLESNGFVENYPSPDGKRARRPRHERGDRPYRGFPDYEGRTGGPSSPGWPREDLYFKLPQGFFTNGWIAVLPGRSVAALCVLLDQANSDDRQFHYVPTRDLRNRYGISDDAWYAGLEQLHRWGLVTRRRRRNEGLGGSYLRSSYRLERDRFRLPPDPDTVATPLLHNDSEAE